MVNKKIIVGMVLVMMFTGIFSACGEKSLLDPENPVTISMWHNYGGQMGETMNALVDEFNAGVGREEGIILNVTAISSSANLQENLIMAANEDPEAQPLPDIATAYPRIAVILQQKDMLVNLDQQFTQEEKEKYVDEFIAEGVLGDGGLYVFPIAKSTEVLFVNKTLFDSFGQDTGITMDSLSTFEGIARASEEYYKWSGGKSFYTSDSWFNVFQIGMEQQGDKFILDENINYQSEIYEKIYNTFMNVSGKGGIAISDGYSSELGKVGDIVCSTGSTAGVLFYGDTITYENNVVIEVEYEIMPYPVFEGGEKVAIQRGGGMCVMKSEPKKEYASAVFLKWFTEPAQNMRFISRTGYLPVTEEAFSGIMDKEIETVENENIKKLLKTAVAMFREYKFYTPEVFEGLDDLSKDFQSKFKEDMMR